MPNYSVCYGCTHCLVGDPQPGDYRSGIYCAYWRDRYGLETRPITTVEVCPVKGGR